MPKVGDKHFPYTAEGEKAAQKESERTGKPVEHGKHHPKEHKQYAAKVKKFKTTRYERKPSKNRRNSAY